MRLRRLLPFLLLATTSALRAADPPAKADTPAKDDSPGERIYSTSLTCKIADKILAGPGKDKSYLFPAKPFLDTYDRRDSWKSNQDALGELIGQMSCTKPGKAKDGTDITVAVDLTKRDAAFTFVFVDKDGAAHRLVYSRVFRPDFQSKRLVGHSLFDLHLIFKNPDEEEVRSQYAGAAVPNPLIGGIATLVSTVAGAFSKSTLFYGELIALTFDPTTVQAVTGNLLIVPTELERSNITIQDSKITVPSDDEATPLTRALLTTEKVAMTTKYLFAPPTTAEVGLGAALIAGVSLNQPAKVDSSTKNLVDDTPTTPMTYVAFNWRPWGFDESRSVPKFREAFRIVLGPTLTPNPGFALGVGLSPPFRSILRTVSIQVGYSVMLANVLRTEDTLGKPPNIKEHQTRRGAMGAAFIGIGYGLM